MQLDLKTLVSKLNPVCKKALEGAAQICVSQTNFNVEVEHVLLKLIEAPETDLAAVFKQYGVETPTVIGELTALIDTFKRGNSRTPALSPQIADLLQEAWVFSSLGLRQNAIRSGALLLSALDNEGLRLVLQEHVPSLALVPVERLREDLPEMIKFSPEVMPTVIESAKADAKLAKAARKGRQEEKPPEVETPASDSGGEPLETLDLYTISLTDQALVGAIDPIVGRDAEIRQLVDILMRRRQNNPILTGEAGVGKTAVVEGFAQRIADGDVPPPLRDVDLRVLDLGLLQAGASMKGEFEERLKGVIDAVAASAKPIILFIDEAHTLIGAGGAAGSGDAANLLKPALARGELRTIAATTWAEYKKYVEKDPALARRFQVVKVDEPDEDRAIAMLRGLARRLEDHHKVTILDEALSDAVKLSARYIAGRQLPDKAISVLDTACARVAIAQAGTPPSLEAAGRSCERIALEIDILKRERVVEEDHEARLTTLADDLKAAEAEREKLTRRWEEETAMVEELCALRAGADDDTPPGKAYADLAEKLAALQDNDPMVPVLVDGDVVAQVIAGWTGIPVGRMMRDEISGVLNLEDRMCERIIGQDAALASVAKRIRTYRAGLDDPVKPVGVFLFVGPSGVGKTETALTLAELLFGGEDNLITVNMSEFQEAHTVSTLKGAPPGYVGFGQGGVLTEAVRRNPYSVVLLDEIEKAHPDVLELFFQVFDKGNMEDGEGVEVDFRNTVIILTSNAGDDIIVQASKAGAEQEAVVEAVRPTLLKLFKPAFLGRLITVPYGPLDRDRIRAIVDLKLSRLQDRFVASHGATLNFDDAIADLLADRAGETESGARAIDAILTNGMLPSLSDAVLTQMADEKTFTEADVSIAGDGGFDIVFR